MVPTAALSLLLLAGLSAAYSGDRPATIKEFPSIVQIQNGYSTVWVQTCVGVILNSRNILTVAHCFFGPLFDTRFRTVRAGATERGRDGVVVHISGVRSHPDFSLRNGFNNDIAVIQTATALPFGDTIKAAHISGPGAVFPANVPVTIASWGRTTQDAIWADRQLRSNVLYTVDHKACVERYKNLHEAVPVSITITDNMLCSRLPTRPGQNLGVRDGGAPLFYNDVLVGIVASGMPYKDNYPLIATDVSSYSKWIVANAF